MRTNFFVLGAALAALAVTGCTPKSSNSTAANAPATNAPASTNASTNAASPAAPGPVATAQLGACFELPNCQPAGNPQPGGFGKGQQECNINDPKGSWQEVSGPAGHPVYGKCHTPPVP